MGYPKKYQVEREVILDKGFLTVLCYLCHNYIYAYKPRSPGVSMGWGVKPVSGHSENKQTGRQLN